ncbi:MAG: IS110 family transposase [Desulfobacteraceae bacterium]|jgi:transposase|nr:IS110 family transposase [Desulfobacteraceae bacterium]
MTVKDCTSVKEFWQLKKEIRGFKDHLIVGIGVAEDNHKAFFGTANGKILLKRLTVKNDIEGFEKLLDRVKEMKVKHSLNELVLELEPTA